MDVGRMQQIVIDADKRRSRAGYTKEEREFRDRIEIDLAQMAARGETLDYSSDGIGWELPDLSDLD
jgi:hypothetical protein